MEVRTPMQKRWKIESVSASRGRNREAGDRRLRSGLVLVTSSIIFLGLLAASAAAQTTPPDNTTAAPVVPPTYTTPDPTQMDPTQMGTTPPSQDWAGSTTWSNTGSMQNGTTTGAGMQQGNQTGRGATQQGQGNVQNQIQGTQTQRRMQTAPQPPTEFQLMVASTTGRRLAIFGASIFAADLPTTFAPVTDVPVGADYVIGPGDQLQVQVWGQVNQQGTFTVDRTGAISIPQVGTVHVAGTRFDQLPEMLRSELGRVYRNFHLNVSMGQLRTIQVFVVGQARQPGSYSISSMSTLLNGLFASGGPTPQGSLRDIQVKRGDQTVVDFDLYDLLLHGDKSKDVQLEPGDVIFIPAVGPQVAVTGSVHNPAIYELRKGGANTVKDVLALAGGRTNIAAGSKVRVDRIVDRAVLTSADVDLNQAETMALEDGDIVSVNSIVDRFKNAVTLRGNVANPGRYVWHPGMRISDLIPDKDALVTRNYWQRRNRLGQVPIDYQPEMLTPAQQVQQQQALQRQMQQQTSSNGQAGATNLAQGTGGQSEGSVQLRNDGSSATSSSPSTATDQNARNGTNTTSQGGSSVGSALTQSSNIFSPKTDVVLSAPDIDWSYAVVERQSKQDLKTSLISFNLGKLVLGGDQTQNVELQPGDVVTIFSTADLRVPTAEQTRIVRLEGEFVSAGVYSVEPGETLRHLLQRAGGFTPDAYLYASEFTRQSTKRVEQQRLNEYADQLEAEVSSQQAGASARALNPQDAVGAAAGAIQAQTAIARLRRAQPTGRIVLQLNPDSHGIGDVPDLALEDGDRFVVPRVPSSVEVAGQVYSANAFVFERGRHVKDYVKQAGGPTRDADKRRTFVLRADGSVYSDQYGNVPKAKIFPGDTVVVPLQLNKRAILRTVVDISNIIGQLGLGIAALSFVGL